MVIRSVSGGRQDFGGPDCELTVILGRGLWDTGHWPLDDADEEGADDERFVWLLETRQSFLPAD